MVLQVFHAHLLYTHTACTCCTAAARPCAAAVHAPTAQRYTPAWPVITLLLLAQNCGWKFCDGVILATRQTSLIVQEVQRERTSAWYDIAIMTSMFFFRLRNLHLAVTAYGSKL